MLPPSCIAVSEELTVRHLAPFLLLATLAHAETPMPDAPRAPLTETLHGVAVDDPYRPLESMDTAAAWIDAQNARTDAWLAAHPRDGVAERLEALFRIGYVGSPQRAGDRVFFVQKLPGAEQPALFVARDGEAPRVLVDPVAVDAAGQVALDWYHASQDGRRVAYGLSKDGDEVSTLRIIEVDTGAVLDDAIPNTRACSLSWLPDGSGFVYTRHQDRTAYDRHVYLHRIGDAWADDVRLMGKERLPDRADWPSLGLSPDGHWLAVVRYRSWSESSLHLLDRRANRWIDVDTGGQEGIWSVPEFGDGLFYATSTHGHPNGRVVAFEPGRSDPAHWREVVGEGAWPIQGAGLVKGGLVVQRLVDAVSQVTLHGRDGAPRGELKTPVPGTIDGLSTRPDEARVLWSFNSFFYPPTLFETTTGPKGAEATRTVLQVDTDLDLDAYTVEQVEYRSYDGTAVPMFLVHKKGLVRDGSHRTLLYGYGGFSVPLTPTFARNVLFWLEQGGVYAVANLRGGGEKGEAWHDAGKLGRKFQVFADFEYALRHLVRAGYSRPDRLAIMGGSNGGLLVGATLTRVPHLFAAAVARVGLYDMVRYHTFPPAELWKQEYGDPDDAAQLPFLWAYSPYHQVVDGVRYPAVLASAAENDTRVHWAHTAKFVARLQAAQAGEAPILMRFERAAGHGAGKATRAVTREYVELYRFLMASLGGEG